MAFIDSTEAPPPYEEPLHLQSSLPGQCQPVDKATIRVWIRCIDPPSTHSERLKADDTMLIRQSTTYMELQTELKARFLSLTNQDQTLSFSWKTKLYPADATLSMSVRGLTWVFARTKMLDGRGLDSGPRSFLQADFSRLSERDMVAAAGRAPSEDCGQSLLLLGMIQGDEVRLRPLTARGASNHRSLRRQTTPFRSTAVPRTGMQLRLTAVEVARIEMPEPSRVKLAKTHRGSRTRRY
ncbi:hypothetical protein LTR36_000097 [Oleoguttula mirabilis]|uniref:Ubiquitin-like domain-containing protein n=1 Tax=Oleoguttula mirabilis TaxID=1507867 RepID=A0AAV9JXK8_9PEZI|nr:hypothetical protein LTR36_000097 [Oleoguttula mirabilis]